MSQIELCFLHITLVFSLYIDVVLTLLIHHSTTNTHPYHKIAENTIKDGVGATYFTRRLTQFMLWPGALLFPNILGAQGQMIMVLPCITYRIAIFQAIFPFILSCENIVYFRPMLDSTKRQLFYSMVKYRVSNNYLHNGGPDFLLVCVTQQR